MRRVFCAVLCAVVPILPAANVLGTPPVRTPDQVDSWLVLYNLNSPDSIAWKDFYLAQWGIPAENALGLNTDANLERVHRDHYRDQIYTPVVAYLNQNPAIKARIMGIVVGYRVPGNCYLDETHPQLPGGGGWSITNNFADLSTPTYYQRTNPHYFVYYWQGPRPRLTKDTLAEHAMITARIDAPTLNEAKDLTRRAKAIWGSLEALPASDRLLYDYHDPGAAAGDEWMALRTTVESGGLNNPQGRYPWNSFESDTAPSPNSAVHLSYYRVAGWQSVPWNSTNPGSRILGYALNSWGATTVRSTTAHNGRFVPNCLFRGQFAAALGATAEPFLGNEPDPSTIIWGLSQGWTLGEAVFRANPYRNFMWELVGDPLLRVPFWFNGATPCASDAGEDSALVAGCNDGPTSLVEPACRCLDRDLDGDVDLHDVHVVQRESQRAVLPADCDGNGRFTPADFTPIISCFAGPGAEASAACACVDFDADHDVDLFDLAAVQRRVGY